MMHPLKNTLSDKDKSSQSKHYQNAITQMLYQNAGGATSGSTINAILITYVLWPEFPAAQLLVWFIAGMLVNGVRWFVVHQFRRESNEERTSYWLTIYRILALLSGTVYGILAWFFFYPEQIVYQVLVILLVGGMGAAAVGTHGVDKVTYRAFMLSAMIPLIARCFGEGNDAYITMGIMLCLLAAIMTKAANQTHQIMLENFMMSESLRYRATHDGLVDLLNREEFEKNFRQSQSLVKEDGVVTALIFIDLDNFKQLNDSLGHMEGDRALIKISHIIRESIRKTDIAARFGGDEFIILVHTSSLTEVIAIAEKVSQSVKASKLEINHQQSIDASIGIGYSDKHDIDLHTLLHAADQACYQAKNSGKGKIAYQRT